ncbi:glutathione S-transferase T3-like [Castanea sativa]|uniref:glutathione S-transferase T3-like n=1 Tax=Castanea sativa TaxID=21020 RepID=UPI003F64F2CD
MPLYTGIIEGQIDVNSPLLGVSQNNPISSLEVEITTSNKPPRRGTNFRVEEDSILVSTWLNTSINAVHGNELKQERFWEKIWQCFCKYNPSGITRTAGSIQSRWGMINRETSRFCGFIVALEAAPHSGTTKQDNIENAKAMYKEKAKKDFPFEHCWHVLKHQPKWSMPKEYSRVVLPPTQDSISIADGDDVSLVDDTTNFERPIGRKAKKANQKNKASGKDVGEYLAKKMKVIEDLQEQEKESLRIKAERV